MEDGKVRDPGHWKVSDLLVLALLESSILMQRDNKNLPNSTVTLEVNDRSLPLIITTIFKRSLSVIECF